MVWQRWITQFLHLNIINCSKVDKWGGGGKVDTNLKILENLLEKEYSIQGIVFFLFIKFTILLY